MLWICHSFSYPFILRYSNENENKIKINFKRNKISFISEISMKYFDFLVQVILKNIFQKLKNQKKFWINYF